MVCRREYVLRRNGCFFDLARDSIGPTDHLAATDSCPGQDRRVRSRPVIAPTLISTRGMITVRIEFRRAAVFCDAEDQRFIKQTSLFEVKN